MKSCVFHRKSISRFVFCKCIISRGIAFFFSCLLFFLLFFAGFLTTNNAQAAVFRVNKFADTADGICSDSDCSLREAVIAANTSAGSDTIVIPAGTFSLSITGSYENASLRGDLDITDDLVITGAGDGVTIIAGNAIDRVFHVLSGHKLEISGVTIEGGSASCPQLGGAILNEGIFTLSNATVKASRACNGAGLGNTGEAELIDVKIVQNNAEADLANTGFGGGVFNGARAHLRLDNCTIMGNSADADGGGIYNFSEGGSAGEVVLGVSKVEGNEAAALGGGICNLGTLYVHGSEFSVNTGDDGGAIVCLGRLAYAYIDDVQFIDNYADGRDLGGGGSIFNYEGTVSIVNCVFSGNRALGEGGGAISNRGGLEIYDSVFQGNEALYHSPEFLGQGTSPGFGGAILLIDGSSVFILNCSITDNEAAVSGGAIYNDIGSDLNIANSVIKDNKVVESPNGLYGGAILNQGALTLRWDVIENNRGMLHSGGIENSIGTAYISNTVIKGNRAYNAGGIGNFLGGKVYITGSTISDNVASAPQGIAFGGGILNDAGSTTHLVNSTISGNQANAGGGISNNNSIQGVILRNVTVALNTAGVGSAVYNWGGTIDSGNTIISGNCNVPTGGGQSVSRGGNLEGPGNTCGFIQQSDIVRVSDLRLQPLADNGGPTPTHALRSGSPAIDRANAATGNAWDQRSSLRPVDGNGDGVAVSDAGAFEYGAVAPPAPGAAILELIGKYYQDILGRPADSSGLTWWQKQIERMRGLGISTSEGFILMAKLFFNSKEYKDRGRSDEEYVRDLYRTFLGRDPDAGGLSFWIGRLGGGDTRNTIMNNFMFCDEFRNVMTQHFGIEEIRPENDMVNNFYRGLLSRLPDTAGFNYWVNRFREAQCRGDDRAVMDLAEQISSLFLSSDEYQGKNRSHTEYVEDLYDAIMRRPPDPGGMAYWVSELAGGTRDREEILQYFITMSSEFRDMVASMASISCYPGI